MKYYILDDCDYKRNRIKKYVSSIDKTAEFDEFDCACDFLGLIRENLRTKEVLNNAILFLDWNFPFYHNEGVSAKEGEHILITLELRKFEMKVIIVSSDEVESNSDYSYVVGSIVDDCSVWQESKYRELLEKAKDI